jgi:hypothetical protein
MTTRGTTPFARALACVFTRAFMAALLFLALPGRADAQLPTPQALMARHDSLIGGRAVLGARESMRISGVLTIAMAQIESPFEILKRKPNSYLLRSSLGPLGELLQGFDGTTAWAIEPGGKPAILTGELREQVMRQADFYGDLHDTSRFRSATTVGETEFEGNRAYEVRLVRHDGSELTEYFDVATGLSAGGVTTSPSPAGSVRQVSVHTDYKDFDGYRVASRIVQRNPNFEVVLSITRIEFNTVDSASVALPESVKALVKPSLQVP